MPRYFYVRAFTTEPGVEASKVPPPSKTPTYICNECDRLLQSGTFESVHETGRQLLDDALSKIIELFRGAYAAEALRRTAEPMNEAPKQTPMQASAQQVQAQQQIKQMTDEIAKEQARQRAQQGPYRQPMSEREHMERVVADRQARGGAQIATETAFPSHFER